MPAAAPPTLTTDDRIELLELYARYTHDIDEFEQQAWLDNFADDGTFDVDGNVMHGRDAITHWYDAFEQYSQRNLRHYTSNVGFRIDNGDVVGRAYVMVLDVTTTTFVATGTYLDRLTKTPDGWRFAKRQLISDKTHEPNGDVR